MQERFIRMLADHLVRSHVVCNLLQHLVKRLGQAWLQHLSTQYKGLSVLQLEVL